MRGHKALLMQGAQLAEDPSSDEEAHDARLSADMAARVAAVSAISQLAQVASQQQRQPNDSTLAPSDMQHAGMLLQPDMLDPKKPSGRLAACTVHPECNTMWRYSFELFSLRGAVFGIHKVWEK